MSTPFDLIVIGAGNAMDVIRGTAAAGMRVAVVEKGPLGGTCPNRGCIPSKLVLAHADVAQAIRTAKRFHIDARIEAIDAGQVLRDTADYVGRFDGLLEQGLGETVTLIRGHGRFVDDHTLEVDGERLGAPRVVLATGSRPRPLDLGVPYWTSDDVFALDRAPKSITIVGGGFVAAELAHFFSGVGIETRMIVRDDRLLPAEEQETRAIFSEAFTQRVRVDFHSEVTAAELDGRRYRITIRGVNGSNTHESEALLLAIGRVPNSDRIGIENTGVKTNERGYVVVNDHLHTGVDSVYAMGDVTGRHMFTHAASLEARYLAKQILGETDEPLDYGPMPHAVFTEPELAGVGQTERQLREAGVDYLSASAPYSSATKGRAIKEEHGLVKFLLDREGKILGAHIVGAHASILLHEIIPVMKWRNHISSLTEIIHVHPSLPEVVRAAARKAEALLA